jgi:hypothetical protein
MATRTWFGGTGNWFTAVDWVTAGGSLAPQPDDSLIVGTGTVTLATNASLVQGAFDAESVTLGGGNTQFATLIATSATFGARFSLTSSTVAADAALLVVGAVGYAGSIAASAAGGDFAITATTANGGQAADFVLRTDGRISVTNGDTLSLTGRLDNNGTITVGSGSTLLDNGTLNQADGFTEIQSGATLAGNGTIDIGRLSSLYLDAGSAITHQAVAFTAPGGRLMLGSPGSFAGSIADFAVGDLIDLTAATATAAAYNAATGLLTVRNGAAVVASLAVQNPGGTNFITVADGTGGTLVELAGTTARVDYTIAGDDIAMGGPTARATLTTAAGAAITGAGVKVGIISDSFDAYGRGGAADPANVDAANGLLPANPVSGYSAVTVLQEGSGTGLTDEGRAMAELVHQTAPGAQIYFDSSGGTEDSFAAAVTALQQAGCTVIVDDVTLFTDSFFQPAGPIDTAIETAIADGVSYFASAGNYASAYYEATFAPALTLLPGGTNQVMANIFDNGTALQTITIPGGTDTVVELQWDTPFPAAGQSVPDSLVMSVYSMAGQLVTRSIQIVGAPDFNGEPAVALALSPSVTTQYQIAITQAPGTPSVGLFKYILFGSPSSSEPGGTIDDPQAGLGSGIGSGSISGHQLLADVNTVGAVDYAETPAFGEPSLWSEFFSSVGPSVDFLAPDGSASSVTGLASFYGTSAAAPNAAAVAALMLQANPSLSPAQVSAVLKQSAVSLGLSASQQGAGLIQAVGAVQLALADNTGPITNCYAAGTRILTEHGARPIETLAIGDRVVAWHGGRLAPVRWLGHARVACRYHPRPWDVWPVRVSPDAFGPGLPHTTLHVSPDHAVFVAGVLVPIRYLLNHATIRQIRNDTVEYWHVELDRHDVLIAEGLPAESYLDTGNRHAFTNGGPVVALRPDFARQAWAAQGCAPLVDAGPALTAIRATLLAQAATLGHATTEDPDLTILADGVPIMTAPRGMMWTATLPRGVSEMRLRSRQARPSDMFADSADTRLLGVAVGRIAVDGMPWEASDPEAHGGWHRAERDWRWTDGDAVCQGIPAGSLEVALAMKMTYRCEAVTPQQTLGREGLLFLKKRSNKIFIH